MLEEFIKRTWPPIDSQSGPRQLEVSHPLPCPCKVYSTQVPSTHHSHSQSCFKDAALREQCVIWDHLDGICDWTQLRPLYTLLNSGGQGWRAHLVATKFSLVCKFPCLLNLPRTNLEWSASFFSLSLPSMYGGRFMNQQKIVLTPKDPIQNC